MTRSRFSLALAGLPAAGLGTPPPTASIPDELEIPEDIRSFSARFATDEACAAYLFKVRYPDGFICPHCGSRRAWRTDPLWSMICENSHRVSITSGTVMHKTKQALTTWFHAAYLVSTLTPGISGVQFQRQLGITRYETAFQLLHKLRAALVNPDREPLHDEVEVDETFVGGRGRDKTIVIGGVEIVRWVETVAQPGGPAIERPRNRAGRVRFRVIPDETAASFVPFVTANVRPGSVVHTDGDPSYSGLAALGYAHQPHVQGSGRLAVYTNLHLHRVFSNLKAWLMGTHHGAVRGYHLQAYLNEYAFRFNRRFWVFPTFLRALTFSAGAAAWPEYETLYATKRGEGWVHPLSNVDPGRR